MQSATNSGLKQKVLDHYKREIIQTYGFHYILTLTNLEDAGLIKVQVSSLMQPKIRHFEAYLKM